MGIRLPGGDHDAVPVTAIRCRPNRLISMVALPTAAQKGRSGKDYHSWFVPAECIRAVRHAR